MEKLVECKGGQFACGDAVTLADCYLVPQVYNAERYRIDLGAFPRVCAAAEAARALPAFIAARPEAQPDFP